MIFVRGLVESRRGKMARNIPILYGGALQARYVILPSADIFRAPSQPTFSSMVLEMIRMHLGIFDYNPRVIGLKRLRVLGKN